MIEASSSSFLTAMVKYTRLSSCPGGDIHVAGVRFHVFLIGRNAPPVHTVWWVSCIEYSDMD